MSILNKNTPQKLFQKTRLASFIGMLALGCSPILADDNDELEKKIAGVGATHNASLLVAITPFPGVSDAAELVSFGANLYLKYIKAPLTIPRDSEAFPNSADQCSYTFTMPQSVAEYKNLLGAWDTKPLPQSWGPLGRAHVEHFNTDVIVSVDHIGEHPFATTELPQIATFPAGNHTFQWQAETQISPTFDGILPLAFFGFTQTKYYKSIFNVGDTSASQAAKQAQFQNDIAETLTNIAKDLGLISGDLLIQNGISNVTHAEEEHQQIFSVFDVLPPTLTSNMPFVSLEATDIGGAYYQRNKEQLFNSVTAFEPCGRSYTLENDAPILFPLGETVVTWTASDLGPNINFQPNRTTLEQTIVVSDTQAPIMIPPAGKVLETNSSGVDAVDVALGLPRVVDLADSSPSIASNAPAFFPVNSRTEVVWNATDASNNNTQASQWITVKELGTNTTPTAQPINTQTLTAQAVDIKLSGNDDDFLDGRFDPLSFNITQRPQHGEFISPLYPYFIEDYRTQPEGPYGEEFLLAENQSTWVYDNFCDPEIRLTNDQQAVFSPKYMVVTDDGTQFIYDFYYTCDGGNKRGVPKPRISKWDSEGNFISHYNVPGDIREEFVIDRNGDLYFIKDGGAGSSSELFLSQCSPDFVSGSANCETSLKFRSGSAPGLSVTNLTYARVDSQRGLAYLTDKRRLYVFDVRGGSEGLEHVGTLHDGEIFLSSCSAAGSSSAGFTIDIDSEGSLYIANSCADKIHKFSPTEFTADGEISLGSHIGWLGKCDSSSNNACNEEEKRSKGYSCTDQTCSVANSGGDATGQFNTPLHLTLDPNDILYVADYANQRIQRFTPDGSFAGEAVSTGTGINKGEEPGFILGNFDKPKNLSVNSTQFFIVDQAESFVHVFETSPLKDITENSATVTYVSDFDFHSAADQFSYSVTDGLATSANASVNITVDRNFRAPEASDALFKGFEDQPIELNLDASDPDGVIGTGDFNALDVLSYRITQQPKHGQLSGSKETYSYRPNNDFNGEDSFEFVVNDGVFDSEPATVSIEIAAINDPPELIVEMINDAALGFEMSMMASFFDDNLFIADREQHFSSIDWGDGSTTHNGPIDEGGALVVSPTGESVAGILLANHRYDNAGTYTLNACLVDIGGGQDCKSQNINIELKASLAITVDQSVEEVPIGDEVEFIVEVFNLQPSSSVTGLDAHNVSVIQQMAEGLSLMSVESEVGSCSEADNLISCELGTMTPDESFTITLTAKNNGSSLVDIGSDFIATASTSSKATREAYIGYSQTVVLADSTDKDNDGIYDAFEAAYGLDSTVDDSEADADGDGLSNREEFLAGTAANNSDSDGDDIADGWEARFDLNPLLANDANIDSDGDGFSNKEEYLADRNPSVDEKSGNRLVPIESFFGGGQLSIPAVQAGNEFYDLEFKLVETNPVVFELTDIQQRFIKMEVPDANHFNGETSVVTISTVEVDGERFEVGLQIVNADPIQVQVVSAIPSTVTP